MMAAALSLADRAVSQEKLSLVHSPYSQNAGAGFLLGGRSRNLNRRGRNYPSRKVTDQIGYLNKTCESRQLGNGANCAKKLFTFRGLTIFVDGLRNPLVSTILSKFGCCISRHKVGFEQLFSIRNN
jgi:hypothetical protein